MTYSADIVIESETGQPIAIVEVIAVAYLDRAEAIGTRQNLVADYSLPRTPFLLLVSQDRGFLWSTWPDSPDADMPDLEFSMEPVVRRFAPEVAEGERLRGESLRLVVFQWLLHLTAPTSPNGAGDVPLRNTPFARAIQYGRVLIGAPV